MPSFKRIFTITSSSNTLFQILKLHFKKTWALSLSFVCIYGKREVSLCSACWLSDCRSSWVTRGFCVVASGVPAGTPLPFLGGCLTEASTLGGISLEHIPGQGESILPPPFSWHVLEQPSHHELLLTSRVQGKKTFLPYGATHGKPWKVHTAHIKRLGLTMWESGR